MKSRSESLIRLRKFQVDEKRRQVAQIEMMIGDFERMAGELDQQIEIEQQKTGISDVAHFAYSTFAKAALQRRTAFKPYVVKAPVTLDVIFKNYRPAEMLAFLSSVQRTTSHGIRFVGKDMVEVSKFLEFIGTYEPGLAP